MTSFAGVCACEAVEEACGVEAGIKWVNDLYVGGRKLAGVLVESVTVEGGEALVVGVGINGTSSPEVAGGVRATCLADHAEDPDLELVCALLARRLVAGLTEGFDADAVLDVCRRRSVLLGREVGFDWQGARAHGTAVGIGRAGELLVRVGQGTVALTHAARDIRLEGRALQGDEGHCLAHGDACGTVAS